MAESKVIDLEVKTNLGSLKSQLREAQAEVAKMSEKFGAASIEASNAAKAAGILKDKIGDAKALTDAFNPDAKFKSVTASISGVAGGFAAYEGAMNLVGVKSEEVEAALLKVQSAMAISQGLQSVGESIDSFKQLGAVVKSTSVFQGLYNFVMTGSFAATTAVTEATVAETAATVAQGTATVATATATTGATTAMKLFRLALISTGIGALIVGIGLLIANFDNILNLFSDSAEANKRNAAAVKANTIEIEKNVKANDKRSDSLKTSNDYQYAMAKATGATNEQLREMALRHEQSTIEMEKNSVAIATQVYWKNKLKLQQLINAEADEEDIKNQRKNAEDAHKALAKEQQDYHAALANKKAVIRQNNIEIAAENYEANKKEIEDTKSHHVTKNKIVKDSGKSKEEIEFDLRKAANLKMDEEFAAENAALKKQEDEKNAIELAGIEARSASQREQTAKDINDKKKRDADELTAAKTLNAQKLQAVQDGFNTIANLAELFAGKNKKQQKIAFDIQKAANIANATIDTYKAAQGAYASLSGVPIVGPVLGAAAAGVAVTAGLLNVKKIASTSFNGGTSGGGGSTSSDTGGGGGGSSAPSAPQSAPNFNLVGATGLNQLDMLGKPIQAFVVGGEVTTYQELERNRLRNATL
jgi:hypothetical protein